MHLEEHPLNDAKEIVSRCQHFPFVQSKGCLWENDWLIELAGGTTKLQILIAPCWMHWESHRLAFLFSIGDGDGAWPLLFHEH